METTARMGGFFITSPRMGETEARTGRTENRMDEQNDSQMQDEVVEQPQGSETDWKAEARKWEKRAKEHAAAAKELDALKAERMTESEKLQARAEKAEAELSRLSAERELADAATEVSKQTEVPRELLLFCKDRESMEAFAEIYAAQAQQPVHAAPPARKSRIVRENETPTTNRDVFAEMASNIL